MIHPGPAAVARVAERLGVSSASLRLYGKRDQTRSDHLGLIAKYLEWQTAPAGSRAMKELEQFLPAQALPDDTGMVRLDEDEHLVVPPLSAEDVPAEAKALKDELAGMLPFAPIASLLIELDAHALPASPTPAGAS
ncbi:DUF4158 domain-containing protein [Streptosporangium vulgare]|uniref:DUF4158 domain-containing protein n=1 Tax=Streptosporangium vulgare TaxID=46190 RepID=A0ABV5T9H7_9ACTN